MIKVVGVRFRSAGKIYYFDPQKLDIKKGEHVIVETARGVEYGTVVLGIKEIADDEITAPLKPVIRIATPKDDKQEASNREKEKSAMAVCLEKIKKHKLDMKLIDAEYTFDNNKVLFYFTADGRVDFRELVKDLAAVFKTRIELRQIGVRDETKIVGGIGICGRPLCCHTFLDEEETYEELNRRLPNVGDRVTTDDGLKGEVHSVNVLRQLVKVLVDDGEEKEIREYKVEQLKFRRRGRRDKEERGDKKQSAEDKALKELENLEKKEGKSKLDED